MKLPSRDEWVRIGYTGMGAGAAYLLNRYSSLYTKGYGYIPPAALATLIILNEDSGATDKDIAAGILGFTSAAQAISFLHSEKSEKAKSEESSTDVQAKENPMMPASYDDEMAKLNKIRAVTGTLGALADIVGKFRGNG